MAEVVNMASNVRALVEDVLRGDVDPTPSRGTSTLATFAAEIGRAIRSDGVFGCTSGLAGGGAVLFAGGACDPVRGSLRPHSIGAGLLPAAIPPLQPTWITPDAQAGGGALLVVRVATERGSVLLNYWFALSTRVVQRRAVHRATALVAAMKAVVQLWDNARLTDANAGYFAPALDVLQHGVMLIDREGHVRFVNVAAHAMIARHDGLHLHGRMLCANRMSDTARLQTALTHSTTAGPGRNKTGDPVMKIRREAGRPLILTVVPHENRSDAQHWLAASAIVFDPDEDLGSRIEPVCRLYGLSPVETKLACLLAGGACLATAAERLNVREQTARSYLKQIFVKTSTNRQAQLVSVMLRSAIRTVGGNYAPLL